MSVAKSGEGQLRSDGVQDCPIPAPSRNREKEKRREP